MTDKEIKEPESTKKEVLIVDKEGFNTLVEEFKEQNETIKQLRADLDRVTYAADNNRLSIYDSRNTKKSVPKCKIRVMNKIEGDSTNQYIIKGWRMIEDTVQEQANGIFFVKQTVEVIYEDKDGKITKEEMPLRTFEKKFEYLLDCEMIAETKDSEMDVEIVEIRLPDGRKIKLDKVFIN
jgi:hypothetical protein